MKKIKCKVCRARFALNCDFKYLATEKAAILYSLTSVTKLFECFDCPRCGCQNALNIRMEPYSELEVTGGVEFEQ